MDSVTIFKNPSVVTEDQDEDSITTYSGHRDILTVNDVEITPACMQFIDAYEGKEFKMKLVIQNCGSRLAFIRLGKPNSMCFEFKAFPEGRYLSPGLKIVRTVTHVYRGVIGIKAGFAPIYVNERKVHYCFYVTLSSAILSVMPQELNFGRIDAVNVAKARTLYIVNSGSKGTQFAVDLGRNELELIVEPMKGIVPARSQVALRVELVGSTEGRFMEEFWIKVSPPLRVVVSGIFITPKLEVRKFISGLDFTLLEFRPTYYGCKATKPVLIKNSSPSHSMFCVMAEVKGSLMPLEKAVTLDENFANFKVKPIDGRMAADKGSVIFFTFEPEKCVSSKEYAACLVKVIRLDCRDVCDKELEVFHTLSLNNEDTRSNLSSVSLLSIEKLLLSSDSGSQNLSSITDDNSNTMSLGFQQTMIGVCLYGVKEEAGVILRPDIILLTDLTLPQSLERELYIENKCRTLPVRVKYCKVASVFIEPAEVDLKPGGRTEVKITIKTGQWGNVCRKIEFDLLSTDYPPESGVFKKVGSAKMKICLEVNKIGRKPRLHQCVVCYDATLKLAPEFPHKMTSLETAKKVANNNYYLNYIKKSREERLAALRPVGKRDYDLTNRKLLLRMDCKCKDPPSRPKVTDSRYTPYIPLAPRELYNLRITPKTIKLEKVAPYTNVIKDFYIENFNSFPIRVWVNSSKPYISFPKSGRYIIYSGERKQILFSFTSSTVGRYYITLNILVNESTLFEITAIGQVLPKTLKLESHEINFTESDGDYKFFNLINSLNACTNFDWDVPDSCFQIYPTEGRIKSERVLFSTAVYAPKSGQPDTIECTLTSESGQKKIVQLSSKRKRPHVMFNVTTIDFHEIPLNIPVRRPLIMTNYDDFTTPYCITNATPIPGISVTPDEGVVRAKDSVVFFVTVHLSAVIDFTTDLVVALDYDTEINIKIKGSVEFPKYAMVPPNLYFRKIAPNALDILAFKIKNLSKCASYISFDFEDFPEFTVTDSEEETFPHINKVHLESSETKLLYLHFHPSHATTYAVNLPYIINGILGPPTETSNPRHFLRDREIRYKYIPSTTISTNIPKTLPLIKISCNALDKSLVFSTLNINFVYFGDNHYANVTSGDFEITNTCAETVKVCIRTDDLNTLFSLTLKSDQDIEYYDVSYLMVLEPGEKIVFEAGFEPYELGEYCIRLPIFLRHYPNNKIFNYLTLRGVYDKPTITTIEDRICFEPAPLRMKNEIRLMLHMNNHFANCEVKTKTDQNGLCPIFEQGRCPKPGKSTLPVSLIFTTLINVCFSTDLIFFCTCDASHTITVNGASDNCLLTNHALSFLIREEEKLSLAEKQVLGVAIDGVVNKNISTYPLFPTDPTCTYTRYMQTIQKTVEQWIYTQCFYANKYYTIPEGFTYYARTVTDQKSKPPFGSSSKPKLTELPLLQLMINLAGPSIKEELSPWHLESDNPLDVLVYTYKTYTNILTFLYKAPTYLPHVTVLYLLNYDQYSLYEKVKNGNYEPPITEETFYACSKQCWIDLMLQIIKVMFFYRMVECPEASASDPVFTLTERTMSIISEISADFNPFQEISLYGVLEYSLLEWLQSCYDFEGRNFFFHYGQAPPKRDITLFDSHLRDGVVLAVATFHYCPYVFSTLKYMFPDPLTSEDVFHNACVLIKTWKLLNLSYKISPFDLVAGSEVEMLLLVTYLYDVLPSFKTRDVITIKTPLTTVGQAVFELQNLGTFPVYYTVLIFGSRSELFRVVNKKNKGVITIPPGKRKKITIEYLAKCVGKTTVPILFSGETPGHKYGRTVVVEAVGVADVSYCTTDIPVKIDLYKPAEVTLHIESPFKVKADYSLYIGSGENNVLFSWEEMRRLRVTRGILLSNDVFSFDEEGCITIKPILCCQRPGFRNVRIYFTNPEVGDFAVMLKISGNATPDNYEDIQVKVPENYDELVCRCRGQPQVVKCCPKIIKVMLPKQNKLLWNSRKLMILKSVGGSELQFWQKKIYTPIGTRILALILSSETHPLRNIIDVPVEYKVVLPHNCPFVAPSSVVVDDVNSFKYFEFPIHLVVKREDAKTTEVGLETEIEAERRFYKFIFPSVKKSEVTLTSKPSKGSKASKASKDKSVE